MADDFLGHAIENGRVRFFSVSAVEKGDPRSNGCPKRYALRYAFGFKEDESEKSAEAKAYGIAGHKRVAHYLTTGEMVLEAVDQRGKHFIPDPGSDLWVEQPFHRVEKYDYRNDDGTWSFGLTRIVSSLTAAGVPFVGYIDCGHRRGINKGAGEGSLVNDPPGTIELIDWKYKGTDLDRDKNPTYKHHNELVHTIQMAGYGMVAANTQPDISHIRLSHGYFFKKPSANARKVTKLHVIDDCRRTWEYVEGVARTLIHVAAETDIEKVPGNVRACDTYGGCPFREARKDAEGRVVRPACSTYQKNSLDVLYGKVAKDVKGSTMPIMQQVMQQAPAQTAPASNPMLAQLAAEEAQQRQQQAQIQQQTQQPSLVDVWKQISSYGRGTPGLGGNAAQEFARVNGWSLQPGGGYAGAGNLGSLMLLEVAHIYQLAGELAQQQAQTSTTPPAATQPMPPVQQAPQITQSAPVQYQQQMPAAAPIAGALPPDAPPSMPQLAMQHPQTQPVGQPTTVPMQTTTVPQDVPLTAPPAKKGRPKKQQDDSTPTQTQQSATPPPSVAAPIAAPPAAAPASVPSAPQVASVSGSPISAGVFVDCIPNVPFTDLHAWIAALNAKLAKMYCVNAEGKPTVQDIRCAPKNQDAFAFGAWKGAVYEVVTSDPPPAGILYVDTRSSEIAAVVADALQTVCERSGALYVRGTR